MSQAPPPGSTLSAALLSTLPTIVCHAESTRNPERRTVDMTSSKRPSQAERLRRRYMRYVPTAIAPTIFAALFSGGALLLLDRGSLRGLRQF